MPCKDSSSIVKVFIDHDDRLIDFDFSKITCSKEIGGGTGYREHCLGKSIEEIFKIDFNEISRTFDLADTEDQFFLYLEWDALRTAIAQYRGCDEDIDPERYKIASINYDEDKIEIRQVILPPKDLPKLISCAVQARNPSD